MRVMAARKLLKRSPKYDQKIIMNVVVGGESWVHCFKSHRKIQCK